MGLLADIQSISTDSAKLATDQGTVDNLKAQIATAQAAVDADSTTVTADDQRLATDLAAAPYNGAAFVSNTDGTISLYQVSPNPPGFTITTVQAAQ